LVSWYCHSSFGVITTVLSATLQAISVKGHQQIIGNTNYWTRSSSPDRLVAGGWTRRGPVKSSPHMILLHITSILTRMWFQIILVFHLIIMIMYSTFLNLTRQLCSVLKKCIWQNINTCSYLYAARPNNWTTRHNVAIVQLITKTVFI